MSSQLEEAYRKLEERAIQLINVQDYTQSILRSITSGVLTVGPDASVATANPAAERLLGISEFEMVPKPISALFRDDGGLSADVSKVLSGRLPLTLREVTMVTGTGKEIHVQASTSRMRAVGGAVLGAVVTLEDVSEVRALTDQLIRADRLAAMGELTAGVAHEVRNPARRDQGKRPAAGGRQLRRAADPELGGGHQAGDRPPRQGREGAAGLRTAQHADDDAYRSRRDRARRRALHRALRQAIERHDRDGPPGGALGRAGRSGSAQAGVPESGDQRRPGDGSSWR